MKLSKDSPSRKDLAGDGIYRLKGLLRRIYGEDGGRRAFIKIRPLMEKFGREAPNRSGAFTEQDVVLITYADSLLRQGAPPLVTLKQFADKHLKWKDPVIAL